MEKDAFVLCRVFHKSNIGPPSGQRYAPFIEDEWDDNKSSVVPGMESVDEAVARHGNGACVEGNSQRKCTEENAHEANAGRNNDQVCSFYKFSSFFLKFFI